MYWYKFWKPSINKKKLQNFIREYERSYDFKKVKQLINLKITL